MTTIITPTTKMATSACVEDTPDCRLQKLLKLRPLVHAYNQPNLTLRPAKSPTILA